MKTKLFLTTFALIVAMVSVQAKVLIDELYYELDDDTQTAEVIDTNNKIPDLGNLVIPGSITYEGTTYSVTSIGNYAFRYCRGLTSITIPNSVTSIGDYAFFACSSLTNVTIPNSVTSIGSSAFYGCRSLTSVTIGNSVTSIGHRVFYDCRSLTNITIPNSVTSIGSDVFDGCFSLPVIDNLRYADTYLVVATDDLSTYNIKEGTKWIGDGAFYECSNLTNITIPNSVTNIERSAFSWCENLTSVVIPNSVTNIGDGAFYGCKGLSSIYNYASIPQDVEQDTFYNVNTNTCVLYVPKASVQVYEKASVWKNFMNIVAIDESVDNAVEEVSCENNTFAHKVVENGNVYIFTPDGRKITMRGAEVK